MDSIVKSYLDNFIDKYYIDSNLNESKKFEFFSIFSLLSSEVNNNLNKDDLEQIIMPDGTKGVDGIAIAVNEKLVCNVDELDNFQNQTINVDFYFFQSKTSDNFSDTDCANFLDVVIDFFSDSQNYNRDIEVYVNYLEIYQKLKKSISSIRNINLNVFYISLGQEQTSTNSLTKTIEIKKNTLERYSLFSNIKIQLIEKNNLIQKHKKAISPLIASFEFVNKISLSGIPNVDEAYIGFIPFSEFKKLIADENQNKIKSLFNDNLRDFLGFENPVNKKIRETLEMRKFNEFSLLNNGITVISESNNGKGNTLVLENYQIVNGCQTSNVLFECKSIEGIDNVLIPLKVIITKDEGLRDEIIITTNSQSSFNEEQLFAITQFQKTLEDYYKSQFNNDSIYYERRTNQYPNTNRNQIIDIREQLKSFMAMFFDLPHLVAGNIGKLVSTHKDKFFQKEHTPIPYYISGLLSKMWEKLLLSDEKYKEFNKYRYHIFMGFRYLVEDLPFNENYLKNPKNYSIKVENKRENKYDKLLSYIRDNNRLKENIDLAIEILKKSDYDRPKGAYSNPITQEYIKHLQEFINSDT